MTEHAADPRRTGRTTLWVCVVAAGLFLVVAANAHLLYVASMSQPACVAHLRQGEASDQPGWFSAAQSSCSPQLARPAGAPGSEP
jgi:hypothetical protein